MTRALNIERYIVEGPALEVLRRQLWGWTLDEEDRAILEAIENAIGAPDQRPVDRVPEMRHPAVQRAMRAGGATDAAMRQMLRGNLA